MLPSNYQVSASIESSPTACSAILTPQDWHRRLGHPSVEVNKHLLSLFGFNKVSNVTSCESCSVSKSHKLPFSLSYNAALFPFQLIHSDVWGPTAVPSFGGFRYYISFVDDFIKFSWLYPLKQKSEAFGAFKSFQFMVQNRLALPYTFSSALASSTKKRVLIPLNRTGWRSASIITSSKLSLLFSTQLAYL